MDDPNFKDALIFICEHSSEGAMGLVINHPSDQPISRVFEELDLSYSPGTGDAPVLVGGPVQQERGFVIHRPGNQAWESTLYISPEVCLTASRDIISDIANQQGPESSFITLGYAGWGAGQLEEELTHNFWLVSEADPHIIFDVPYGDRTTAAANKLGIDLARISLNAGHA